MSQRPGCPLAKQYSVKRLINRLNKQQPNELMISLSLLIYNLILHIIKYNDIGITLKL